MRNHTEQVHRVHKQAVLTTIAIQTELVTFKHRAGLKVAWNYRHALLNFAMGTAMTMSETLKLANCRS
jgi:hypothetical protein